VLAVEGQRRAINQPIVEKVAAVTRLIATSTLEEAPRAGSVSGPKPPIPQKMRSRASNVRAMSQAGRANRLNVPALMNGTSSAAIVRLLRQD